MAQVIDDMELSYVEGGKKIKCTFTKSKRTYIIHIPPRIVNDLPEDPNCSLALKRFLFNRITTRSS